MLLQDFPSHQGEHKALVNARSELLLVIFHDRIFGESANLHKEVGLPEIMINISDSLTKALCFYLIFFLVIHYVQNSTNTTRLPASRRIQSRLKSVTCV